MSKKKRAKVTTADSLALYAGGGLVLIALGVLMLLATGVQMNGDVFATLRNVCAGLAGAFAIILAAVPIWGGVLLLLATQRKVKSKSFWMSCLLLLLLMGAMNLFSSSGSPAQPLMDYYSTLNLSRGLGSGFDVFLARGWEMGAARGLGGGLLGMLIAWPLWFAVGTALARLLVVLGMLATAFFLLPFRPKQAREWLQDRKNRVSSQTAPMKAETAAQEIAWQQRTSPVPSWDNMIPAAAPQATSATATGNQPAPGAPWRTSGQPASSTYGFQPTDNERYARPKKRKQQEPQPEQTASSGRPDTTPPRKRRSIFGDTEEKQTEEQTTYDDAVRDRTERMNAAKPTPVKHSRQAQRAQTAAQTEAEILPWEGEERFEEEETTRAKTPTPALQTKPPEGAWKPELKLPPRREREEEEEEEHVELPYVYPPLTLLKEPTPPVAGSEEEDAMRARRLEETLESFKVPAKVVHITHGPAISRFELEIAAGINVSKITNLGKNIAMSMEVKSVRIEAPIPGKSLVGVEVPNRKVSTVTLREVLDSDVITSVSPQKAPLLVALGKDIAGTPIACNLAKMPHLLIAGATGSGKSVCINTIINSLLYRCSPKEVRMIMVDPKVVELQCYNGIPHLLIPVVSDPHKAAGALAWAVAEMMDRYKKFQKKGVRAIDSYNAHLDEDEEFMPRIVIIIDELADLMMTCKRDVEDHICRLAQLARAAGLHLIVATQRPSVDVITGLIKANIPSRIAFKVSSNVDSRTILDHMGAEQLLGWGDMLYLPTGEFTPSRLQGCFLSDDEVNAITDFIRAHSEPDYDPGVLEQLDQIERENGGGSGMPNFDEPDQEGGDESLLSQAIEMAVTDGQVSTSLIQRRLKIGYARAGRLVDEMERRGIVSAKDGAKPRLCLISREEFEQLKQQDDLQDEE